MPMQLVWLHGPPAAGKLTVAKALQRNHNFKLFHNHLAVDLSMAIYDAFGDKDFHHFTNSIRRQTLSKANELGVARMVMTFMTCAQEDEKEIRRYLEFFESEGIEVYPVQLHPRHDVLLSRSVSVERQQSHKISCRNQLSELLSEWQFLPIEHKNALQIDNSEQSPEDVARQITAHLLLR
ncbi:ATP-binding protein [Marinobacter alexandrii]|jgi:hypothetical protein|uniref:ATP-binding protein n=2 Tax=Marinobacteraceae TaxID=2887365 RepID=UPI0020002B50|nr:ATP-binding protein [Marinobacter alexandrii]MCK2148805.1 ATP-binding protein [Marinobacter alexandrii]